MPFAQKLTKMRKEKGFTQQDMAKHVGVGIAQMRRYEKGKSSPTLEVIKNMARTLGVSADELIFDKKEGVAYARIFDRKLLDQFEMVSKLNPRDREAIKIVLESMIIKGRLEEVMPSPTDAGWSREMRKVVTELRKGADGYSEDEIDDIVDEAVKAVREGENYGREAVGA